MHIKLNRVKLASFFIAILPILSIYKIADSFPLTIGEISLVVIVLFSLTDSMKNRVKIPRLGFIAYFAVFFLFALISILVRGQGRHDSFFHQWLLLVLYYYVIDISGNNRQFDFVFMQKCNVLAGIFVSAVLMVQVFAAYFLGRSITFFLPIFPLKYGLSSAEITGMYNSLVGSARWRPISIFCEPAHFAQFTLLSLVIALFCKEEVFTKRQKLQISMFLSAAILLSYSANGMFVMAMLWAAYIVSLMRHKMNPGKIALIFAGAAVGLYIVITTDFWNRALARLNTVFLDTRSTGTLRLLQGFAVFNQLSFAEKIFGLGFGNLRGFLIENNITTSYLTEVGNAYMNSFSTVLVSGGLVGFSLYLVIWIRMFFAHKDAVSRAAFVVITILFCTSSLFYLCTSVMYLVFINCNKTEEASKVHHMDLGYPLASGSLPICK